ncbi:MAG: RNA polymerase sigma factor [Nannocystales bacterium]
MESVEQRVQRAVAGDADALESVVEAVRDNVYGLAIRMLWHPEDAADATQEILLRIVTGLPSFQGRSSFRTWTYRVAVRALLNMKRGRAEQTLSFEDFGADLLDGLTAEAPEGYTDAERAVLRAEVKIACTQAMLQCLDRDHRMAYLLGEILEVPGDEASQIMDVSAPTFRKRLSRARDRVQRFTASHCGLVSASASCRCVGRIAPAVEQGRIDPKALLFATHPTAVASAADAQQVVDTIEALCDGHALLRSNPAFRAPNSGVQAAGD